MKFAPLLALVVLLAPSKPITKRLVLLVDTSGSMAWDSSSGSTPIKLALSAASQIARQPVDDGHLLLLTYQDTTQAYPGGWIALPDEDGVSKAEAWLGSMPADGDTHLGQALAVALARPESGLTIVVVSDGKLHRETTESLLRVFAEGQSNRKDRAVVGVWGVGHVKPTPELMALAKAGGGGYVVSQ